jgi:hypothetical protein
VGGVDLVSSAGTHHHDMDPGDAAAFREAA